MRVVGIEYAGRADVYNMEVEQTHNYILDGGVVSHNCADEWRYMCMSRPIKPVAPKPEEIVRADPLEMHKPRAYRATKFRMDYR